jgi:diguanylate cyclase (GGDEF)-like protein
VARIGGDDDSASIGASIGIALYPDDEQDPEVLIKRADEAMYGVKAEGKNAFAFAEGA